MAGPGRALSARTAVRGGAWRQFHCVVCDTYFLETHGALFYGKPRPDERLVRVVTALAEGLGLRAAARVFAVDPNTVLTWLREAADQLAVFSCSFLRDVKVNHVQLDELFAVLSAGKTGQGSDIETSVPCSRAPHWVWAAIDPVNKLLLALDVGERTLERAQRLVHQVRQVLSPGWVPLFLSDSLKDYATALLTHYGHWVTLPRRQSSGPAPKLPVAAPARAALCAGRQNVPPPTPSPHAATSSVWDPGSSHAHLGPAGLAHQHRVH